MNVLITGGAGFVGFHLTKYLLENYPEMSIVSIDNLNDYYDTTLKCKRVDWLKNHFDTGRFIFYKIDLNDRQGLEDLFDEYAFKYVVNLAAQAGVRYAKENPDSYIRSNIDGFYTLISISAARNIERFLYASSSSVYGANTSMPFKETDLVARPMSLYAATKLSNEAIASAYFYVHGMETIGLRFFNVYGPWGRPDMAYYKWAISLTNNDPIELRNNGEMYRDMTYVDDAVRCMAGLLIDSKPNTAPEIYNIGSRDPVKIGDVFDLIKSSLNVPDVHIVYKKKGREEPVKTWADTTKLKKRIGFVPTTNYTEGIGRFIDWYKEYSSSNQQEQQKADSQ